VKETIHFHLAPRLSKMELCFHFRNTTVHLSEVFTILYLLTRCALYILKELRGGETRKKIIVGPISEFV
jgi:hypothetical protein